MERRQETAFLAQTLKLGLLPLLKSSRCLFQHCTMIIWLSSCFGSLESFIQVPWHPDPSVRLAGVSRVAAARLSKEALANPSTAIPKGPAYQFRDLKSETSDTSAAVAEATAILRLLHIQDLRVLQTQINEAIVAVQKVHSWLDRKLFEGLIQLYF